MKLTTSAFATTIVLAVIPLGAQVVSAPADSPPKLNIGSKPRCGSEGCDQRQALQGSLRG